MARQNLLIFYGFLWLVTSSVVQVKQSVQCVYV